jgi:hypothetical protein
MDTLQGYKLPSVLTSIQHEKEEILQLEKCEQNQINGLVFTSH